MHGLEYFWLRFPCHFIKLDLLTSYQQIWHWLSMNFDKNSTKIAETKAKFAKNLEFSLLKSKNGLLKSCLNQTDYVVKFREFENLA